MKSATAVLTRRSSRTKQSFKWAGYGPSGVDPNDAGRALLALRKSLGRALKPDDIVRAARPTNSPLHNAFTWDIQKAAIRYWHEQAAHLLRSLRVIVIRDDAPPLEIPLLVSFADTDEPGSRKYDLTMRVAKDADAWRSVIARIRQDLANQAKVLRSLESVAEAGEAADVVEQAVEILERVTG